MTLVCFLLFISSNLKLEASDLEQNAKYTPLTSLAGFSQFILRRRGYICWGGGGGGIVCSIVAVTLTTIPKRYVRYCR
jgi:hypothetical protein